MLNFELSFSTKSTTFIPNSQVSGTVYLETDKVISAQRIDIFIKGIARTGWYEIRQLGQVSEHIPYGSEIYCINAYAILWQSTDGTNLIHPGKYQFPFQFFIPENVPPTMAGQFGSVQYHILTKIIVPNAMDVIRIYPFIVCNFLDLNYDRKLAIGVHSTATEIDKGCLSCSSYPLSVKVGIPKTGYIPGEIIQVTVKITNKTSWVVTRFEIGITQNIIFTGECIRRGDDGRWRGPQVINKVVPNVVTVKNVNVDKGLNPNDIYTLKVPPVLPTYRGNSIITITYTLYVKTFTDAVFSSGPSVTLPLTIGSIAITDSSSHVPSPSPAPSATAIRTPDISASTPTAETTKSGGRKSSAMKKKKSGYKNAGEKEDQNLEVEISLKDDKKQSSNSNINE